MIRPVWEMSREEIAAGLGNGFLGGGPFEMAAVIGLCAHAEWLDEPAFRVALMMRETAAGHAVMIVDWDKVAALLAVPAEERTVTASEPAWSVLRFAHALATDSLGLGVLDARGAGLVLASLREALSVTLTMGRDPLTG